MSKITNNSLTPVWH